MDADRLCSNSLASRSAPALHERAFLKGAQRPMRTATLRPVRGRPTVPVATLRRKMVASATAAEPLAATSDQLVWEASPGRPTTAQAHGPRRNLSPEVRSQVQVLERSLQASPSFDRPAPKARRISSRATSGKAGERTLGSAPSTSGRGLAETDTAVVMSTRGEKRQRGRPTSRAVAGRAAPAASGPGANAGRTGGRRRGTHGRRGATSPAASPMRAGTKLSPLFSGADGRRPTMDRDAESAFLGAIRDRLERGRRQHRTSSRMTSPDAVSMFLHNIGNTGILTKEEEAALARILRTGAQLAASRAELVTELGREPTAAELTAAGALEEGVSVESVVAKAREAKELMVQYNLRLVVAIAKKYTGRGVDFGDLIPEGMAGLEKAVQKFDPDKGFKFSTYAHWWIRQAVSRCVSDHSRVVRLPVHVYDILSKINRVAQELNSQVGRTGPATCGEIGAVLGIPGNKVMQYIKAAKPARSLDSPAYMTGQGRGSGEADAQLLVDTIATEMAPEADEYTRAIDKIVREDINALLSTLPPRERNVIRMRYGLHSTEGRSMTFNDIGAAYGLTKERIRQIEDKALGKLKAPWRQKLLRPHLYGGPPE